MVKLGELMTREGVSGVRGHHKFTPIINEDIITYPQLKGGDHKTSNHCMHVSLCYAINGLN